MSSLLSRLETRFGADDLRLARELAEQFSYNAYTFSRKRADYELLVGIQTALMQARREGFEFAAAKPEGHGDETTETFL